MMVGSAHTDALLVTRALDEALDVFSPAVKEAIFGVLAAKFSSSSSVDKYSTKQIEDFLIETLGNKAGRILSQRFREALEYVDNKQ